MNHPVILFDGICKLCNRFVSIVIRIDKKKIFRFSPLQSTEAKLLINSINLPENLSHDPDTVILIIDDKAFFRSDAVLKIAKHLPYPWKELFWFRFLPLSFRNWIYNFVAKNRYQWFGKRTSCILPSENIIDRFI
jgi:predicted DCC family thiol-disulfide oxidoreductase YuxK